MWKLKKFSATQILCEINFTEFRCRNFDNFLGPSILNLVKFGNLVGLNFSKLKNLGLYLRTKSVNSKWSFLTFSRLIIYQNWFHKKSECQKNYEKKLTHRHPSTKFANLNQIIFFFELATLKRFGKAPTKFLLSGGISSPLFNCCLYVC